MERLFKYKEVLEEQKVKIVAAKLKKLASIWWENVKRRRKREGKSKIKTWEKMRQKLTQINTNIPKCVMCQGYGHIAIDCVNYKAVTIVNREINNIFEEEREDIHESFEAETMGEPIYDEEYVGTDICEVFKEEGNNDPMNDVEHDPDDIHEVFEKEENEPLYDGECVPFDSGKSLVARRSLQTTTNKEESCLKHNIFHTSKTSQGKVCDIIVNGGSCENVVSNYMVEKLNLPTKERLHPYKLQWLNKDNE
ncbi:hypothetical protein MTR_1361s0010, partial [Medicago truncatula]